MNSNFIKMKVIADSYLVLYILPSSIDRLIIKKFLELIKNEVSDYVIIDELFPNDNTHFLNEAGHPLNSPWIITSCYSKQESFIKVI